jgi:AraC-like DNA-binding protein
MTAEVLDQLLTTLAVRLHAFSVCEIQQGWRLRVGPSEAIIVHYVLAGSGAVRSGGGPWIPFSPRSVIVVPALKPHDIGEAGTVVQEVRSEDHCTLLDDGLVKFTAGDGTADTLLVCGMISASYAGAWGLFAPLRDPLVEDLSANNVLQQTFELMFAEIAKPSVGTHAMAETLMKQCLILLLRQHLLHAEGASSIFMPLKDQRLARSVTEVLKNPAAPHSVESLASAAGMSRASFADRFSQVYAQTPMDFVQKVRLRVAARLLTTTDLPIKVIASSIGYASRSYFSRAFRAAYGADPKTFRVLGNADEQEPTPVGDERARKAIA